MTLSFKQNRNGTIKTLLIYSFECLVRYYIFSFLSFNFNSNLWYEMWRFFVWSTIQNSPLGTTKLRRLPLVLLFINSPLRKLLLNQFCHFLLLQSKIGTVPSKHTYTITTFIITCFLSFNISVHLSYEMWCFLCEVLAKIFRSVPPNRDEYD